MQEIPDLAGLEFAVIEFCLELQESTTLEVSDMLRLRRNLRSVARNVLPEEGPESPFTVLFDPPVSTDPAAVRKYQRPGPAFAIRLDPERHGLFEAGDHYDLTVLFWGRGVQHISSFASVLAALEARGLAAGEGRFELAAIHSRDFVDSVIPLWERGGQLDALSPIIIDVPWWFTDSALVCESLTLDFITPARLISRGRPLFHPGFSSIFPFILRRVSSMVYAHSGLELISDAGSLVQSADQVAEVENRLQWIDWRRLEGEAGEQDLGGITGSLQLRGPSLPEILWILKLGSLLNLGKGAAFGAGRYALKAF